MTHPGGSVEHWNEEAGAVWLERMKEHFPKLVWLNPEPQEYWSNGGSLGAIRTLVDQHMYPLTLTGIEEAMRFLSK